MCYFIGNLGLIYIRELVYGNFFGNDKFYNEKYYYNIGFILVDKYLI